MPAWDVVCRECGEELPPAFAGRPRSYCSVTCRQKAYRRRKAASRATETTETETAESAQQAAGARGDPGGAAAAVRGRSASAEAIVIRVRVDEPAEVSRLPPVRAVDAEDEELFALDELAEAAFALARRLRARRERERAPDGGEAGDAP
ncbi:hypothetical protein [Actinospica robiniae]|uniref:hypothetical protein n=1 Tax=Actinospica robiniae TaxID=304901 RepID=UPI0003FD38B8|nr:hypothetical protein [Actinospica robiniae]